MDRSCIISLCVILFTYITDSVAVNCFHRADGVYEVNCQSFSRCTEGDVQIVICQHGQAYNNNTGKCDSIWDVPPPCGTYRECADKPNGFYVDMETNCSSYYICTNNLFVGHSLCPSTLVFNMEKQVCDFAFNVAPPCGTATTDSS